MVKIDVRDAIGGFFLIILGTSVSLYSMKYGIGQLQNMGAGYFPFILGIMLAILGAFVFLPALFREGTPIEIDYRNMVSVLLSIIVFAVLLDYFGLVLTTIITTLISTIPGNLSWKRKIFLGGSIAFITTIIFVLALGMTIPVWPWSK